MQPGLKNSFAQDLPELSKKCIPSGFQNSEIILKNYELGEELGFSKKFLDSDKCLNVFSGNALLRDSIPIAQAYSGHQFGQFRLGPQGFADAPGHGHVCRVCAEPRTALCTPRRELEVLPT